MTLRDRRAPVWFIWALVAFFGAIEVAAWILAGGIPRRPLVLVQVVTAWIVMLILAALATRRIGTLTGRIREQESTHRTTLDQVEQRMEETRDASALLRPMSSIAPQDARIELDETQLALVRSGRSIRRFRAQTPPAVEGPGDVAYGIAGGELAAVLSVTGMTPHGLVELRPVKVVV